MEASNVEDNEMSWPVLTLYRRQNRADAAGAGRYRSGVAAEEAWILHGTDSLDTQVYNNESFAKCQGLLGGNPGGRAFFRLKRDSDVARAACAPGTIPQSLDDVSGEEMPLYWKGTPVRARQDLGVDDSTCPTSPATATRSTASPRRSAATSPRARPLRRTRSRSTGWSSTRRVRSTSRDRGGTGGAQTETTAGQHAAQGG